MIQSRGKPFLKLPTADEEPGRPDSWRNTLIPLLPLNPAFEPITLEPEDASDLTIVGEFVRVAS